MFCQVRLLAVFCRFCPSIVIILLAKMELVAFVSLVCGLCTSCHGLLAHPVDSLVD